MYRVTAIFYGIMIATTIGEEVLFVLIAKREVPPFLDSAIGLAAAMLCGFGANRWYLAHGRRTIAEVRALGLQDSACLAEISRRGGTSMLAAIGLFVCFCAAMVGLVTFFEFLYTDLAATDSDSAPNDSALATWPQHCITWLRGRGMIPKD
jgi:hypothetical protein